MINTDAYTPWDLINQEFAREVGIGAGMGAREVNMTLTQNPIELLSKMM